MPLPVSKDWTQRHLARRRQGPSIESLADFETACRHFEIKTKDRGVVRFDPAIWHEEQKRFHAERTGRDLVLKPRQVGFSTLELLRGLHQSLTREAWNTQVVIHDATLADGLFGIVHTAFESVQRAAGIPTPRTNRVRYLGFSHSKSAISVTEAGATKRTAKKKGRSGTIHRVHATEVAFWNEPEESMAGLIGAVPTNGEVLIESTANGAQGYFYDLVQAAIAGDSEYKLHFYPWYQHRAYRLPVPHGFDQKPKDEWEQRLRGLGCDDEQLAFWRSKVRTLTLDKALQEFPLDESTCFRTGGGEWLEPEVVDRLARQCAEPVEVIPIEWEGRRLGLLKVWRRPNKHDRYVVGADVAEGVNGDGSSATVLERRSGDVVATFHSTDLEPGDFGLALAVIGWMYNDALIGPERNNHGHATLFAMREVARYPRIYRHDDDKLGWITTPKTRPILFDDGYRALNDGSLWTPDAAAHAEFKTLVKVNGKPEARSGAHDDRPVSHFIAWQLRARTGADTGYAKSSHQSPARRLGDLL